MPRFKSAGDEISVISSHAALCFDMVHLTATGRDTLQSAPLCLVQKFFCENGTICRGCA